MVRPEAHHRCSIAGHGSQLPRHALQGAADTIRLKKSGEKVAVGVGWTLQLPSLLLLSSSGSSRTNRHSKGLAGEIVGCAVDTEMVRISAQGAVTAPPHRRIRLGAAVGGNAGLCCHAALQQTGRMHPRVICFAITLPDLETAFLADVPALVPGLPTSAATERCTYGTNRG